MGQTIVDGSRVKNKPILGDLFGGLDETENRFHILRMDSEGRLLTSPQAEIALAEQKLIISGATFCPANSAFGASYASLLTSPIHCAGYSKALIGVAFDVNAGTANLMKVMCGVDHSCSYLYPLQTGDATSTQAALSITDSIITIGTAADQFILIEVELNGLTYIDLQGMRTGAGSDLDSGFCVLTR